MCSVSLERYSICIFVLLVKFKISGFVAAFLCLVNVTGIGRFNKGHLSNYLEDNDFCWNEEKLETTLCCLIWNLDCHPLEYP